MLRKEGHLLVVLANKADKAFNIISIIKGFLLNYSVKLLLIR